ncbi:response regulator, partial [bacterium]
MAKSLLIIDAEGKYAEIASVALKASGWTTATVLSLPAALSRIGEMMPDALLCPADLEGMSERQLAAAIRDRKGCSRLPVILVGSKTYAGPNFFA